MIIEHPAQTGAQERRINLNDTDFLLRVGLSLRKYRSIAGLSQEELGGRTECDKNTIGKIERGESDSKLSTIRKLTDGLNISFSRLIKEVEAKPSDRLSSPVEYDYLRLFHYCRQLSPEQFNNLCNTACIYAKSNRLRESGGK